MQAVQQKARTYFTELNGLRGYAALSILLFHSRLPLFKMGWIGVPVFFVLSGFLITRILIGARSQPNYFKGFYYRRALRIFPIYYLTLLVSLVWVNVTACSAGLFPYFFFYLQSFVISFGIEPAYCCRMLNHTWSLSVEELFYLVWPLLVYLSDRKNLLRICLLLAFGSMAYKIIHLLWFYNAQTDPLLFSSLLGSLDALMAGALLGIWSLEAGTDVLYRQLPRYTLPFAFCVFFCAAVLYYLPQSNTQVVSVSKLILYAGTLVLTFAGIAWLMSGEKRISTKLFNNRFIQLTGTISYGLYLYHFLIFSASWTLLKKLNISINPWLCLAIQMALSYLAALVSWYVIEKPVLRYKDRVAQKETTT